MRRTINIIAAVLVMVWSGSAYAKATSCKKPKGVPITVKLKDPKPKINLTKTLADINAKANHGRIRSNNSMTLGLTQSQYASGAELEFNVQQLGNQYCFSITNVKAVFGHEKLDVFVPREYPQGGCQYNVVMRHENEHVRINREGVRKYAKLLRKELEKFVYRFNPKQVKNPKNAKRDAEQGLNGVLRRVTKKFEADIDKKHAVVDKPNGPYAATGACRKWK